MSSYASSYQLLQSFAEEQNLYCRHLVNCRRDLYDENEALKIRQNKLINEIQRIRKWQHKLQKIFLENIKNKFFIMCVKNCTNEIKNFSEDDQQEYGMDQLMLHSIMNPDINYISESIEEKNIRNEKRKESRRKTRKGTRKLTYIDKISEMPKKDEYANVPFHLLSVFTKNHVYKPLNNRGVLNSIK